MRAVHGWMIIISAPFDHRVSPRTMLRGAGSVISEAAGSLLSFLHARGLAKWAPLLVEGAELTLESAASVGDGDLRELGLKLGPRKMLIAAFAELQGLSSAAATSPGGGGGSAAAAAAVAAAVAAADGNSV